MACAEVYLEKKDFSLKDMLPVFSSVLIMTLLMTIPVITSYLEGNRDFRPVMYPLLTLRHYAFALVSLVIAYCWWKIKMRKFDLILKPSAKLAPISYALYIIHVPFIWLELPLLTNIYVITIIKLLLIFSFAYLLEIKLQPILMKLVFKKKEEKQVSGQVKHI